MQPLSPANVQTALSGVRYLLLDVDGVLWSGNHVFPRIPEALKYFRDHLGLKLRYVSNNGTLSRASYHKKFLANGIDIALDKEIFNSPFAAAAYLRSTPFALASVPATSEMDKRESRPHVNASPPLFPGNVFVLGNPEMVQEIQAVLAPGFVAYGPELNASPNGTTSNTTTTSDDSAAPKVGEGRPYNMNVCASAWSERVLPRPFAWRDGGANVAPISLQDLQVRAVVCAFDFEQNVTKLALASMCIQACARGAPGAPDPCYFVASNADPSITIGELGWHMPGAGTTVAALSTALGGRQPDAICGKPAKHLYDIVSQEEGEGELTDPQMCLMVGDRLTTDIAFGKNAGTRTLWVRTGAETEEDVARTGIVPDYSAAGLVDLMVAAQEAGL